MNDIEIPRYIDSQQQFLWWEFDEFVLAIGLFTVGIVTDTLTLQLLVVIPFLTWGLRRFKNNNLEGILFHIIFWLGMAPLNNEFKDALGKEHYL